MEVKGVMVSRTLALGEVCPLCHADLLEPCVDAKKREREAVHAERLNAAAQRLEREL
jgi:hypothetical protein